MYTTWTFQESGAVPNDRGTAERRIMQIGASVSDRSYVPYRSNARTNQFGAMFGVSKEEMAQQQMFGVSDAVTRAESEAKGEFLGITMVPEPGQSVVYGMRAILPEDSTPDKPVVQIISNLGGKREVYNVDVSKVDPQNASQLEMFALLSYSDKMGISDGGAFGSFHQAKVYASNAQENGYVEDLSGHKAFLSYKFDWEKAIGTMMGEYFTAQAYNQYENCKKLLAVFDTFSGSREQTEENADYLEFIRQRKDEIFEKVKKGETEPKIQTGAQSFSEKEWDRLLEQFDSAEEALKELMRQEHARRWKEQINKTEIMNDISNEEESMLVSESTTCTLPSADSGKEEIRYITWYTQEGIFCRKAGQKEGYEWSIAFENSKQYDEVIEYLKQHEKDEDLRFTADEYFWREFLK